MVLPSPTSTNWMDTPNFPSRWFGSVGRSDYELYEEDESFVLTIEMPGFETEDISVTWDEGVLNIAGEHVDEDRGLQRTYHRRFRFPKEIVDEDITAEYHNGVLEVTLPIPEEAVYSGREIEVTG
ncbi:MAG: Hsp20/alpha crystallin family protein [Halobacteriota archaeon]